MEWGEKAGAGVLPGAWFRYPKLAIVLMQAFGESRIKEKNNGN